MEVEQELTQSAMVQKRKGSLLEIEELQLPLRPSLKVPSDLQMAIGVDVLIVQMQRNNVMLIALLQHFLHIPHSQIYLSYLILCAAREELVETRHEHSWNSWPVHLLLQWLERFVRFWFVQHVFLRRQFHHIRDADLVAAGFVSQLAGRIPDIFMFELLKMKRRLLFLARGFDEVQPNVELFAIGHPKMQELAHRSRLHLTILLTFDGLFLHFCLDIEASTVVVLLIDGEDVIIIWIHLNFVLLWLLGTGIELAFQLIIGVRLLWVAELRLGHVFEQVANCLKLLHGWPTPPFSSLLLLPLQKMHKISQYIMI